MFQNKEDVRSLIFYFFWPTNQRCFILSTSVKEIRDYLYKNKNININVIWKSDVDEWTIRCILIRVHFQNKRLKSWDQNNLKSEINLLTYLTITALNPFITSIKTRAVDMVTWFSVTTVTTRQQTPWAVGLCFAYLKKQKTKTKSEHIFMHQLWKF